MLIFGHATPAEAQYGMCEPFTPLEDAGIAYEESVHRARIAAVVIVGIAATAIIAAVLVNSNCTNNHCH